MKVKYDQEVDILYIYLSDKKIRESDEDKPGIIFDYDDSGNNEKKKRMEIFHKTCYVMKFTLRS